MLMATLLVLTAHSVSADPAACNAGDVGFDRPGHDLPGSPFIVPDAAACQFECDNKRVCKQWVWASTPQLCSLKNLVSPQVAGEDYCSATRKADTSVGEAFPPGNYTPFAYIQNPFHRVQHNSWNLRSHDDLNALGHFGGPYETGLSISARPEGIPGAALLMNNDFAAAGIDRYSTVHTKSRLRNAWSVAKASTDVTAEYWQVSEDIFACEVVLANTASTDINSSFDVLMHLNASWDTALDAKGSYTPRDSPNGASTCISVPGTAVSIWAVEVPDAAAGHAFFSDSVEAVSKIAKEWNGANTTFTSSKAGTIAASLTFANVHLDAKSSKTYLFFAGRGSTCDDVAAMWAGGDLATAAEARNQRAIALQDDARFWSGAPVPSGEFSDAWKHGVVYDLNTVRLNLRPAVGIFKTEWDSMQIQAPRIVVAEGSMDYLALSYADIDVAKEVILGLFTDAIAPNVPCVWEDGTPNLVCDDGSVGGTPPAWGGPFKNILSVYQRSSDKEWLDKLYEPLANYLRYWLSERKMGDTDYLTCKCSWECGQDDEPRWSFDQSSGGSVTTRFRVVEMQAATAHAAAVLAYFAEELGRPPSYAQSWREVVAKYTNLTLALWEPRPDSPFGGWFADYDTTTDAISPFGEWNMQLAPLFFHDPALGVDLFPAGSGINASKLAESIKTTFWSAPPGLTPNVSFCDHTEPDWGKDMCWTVSGQMRPEHDAFRLDRIWAPSPWTMGEGAAMVGRRDIASQFTELTLDTVYPVMDKRLKDPNLPMPGNAYECWDTALMDPDLPPISNYKTAEAYGWSSVATVLFIRTIVGFRELISRAPAGEQKGRDDHRSFELAPALPERLLARAICPQEYAVEHLSFQGKTFRLAYTLSCAAASASPGSARKLRVQLSEWTKAKGAAKTKAKGAELKLEFEASNHARYKVSIGDNRNGAWTVEPIAK